VSKTGLYYISEVDSTKIKEEPGCFRNCCPDNPEYAPYFKKEPCNLKSGFDYVGGASSYESLFLVLCRRFNI